MKVNEMISKAGDVMRKVFPYGFIKDTSGAVVFFNRDYNALQFMGQKEFRFDPDEIDVEYVHIAEGRFLETEDGSSYVGTMYFLYEDSCSLTFLDKRNLARYMLKYDKVMEVVIGINGNAFAKGTATPEQEKEVRKLLTQKKKNKTFGTKTENKNKKANESKRYNKDYR